MENRQIDKKTTKQIRIDIGLHQLLKVKAAKSGMSIKSLLEEYLAEILAVESHQENTITPTIDYFREKYRENKTQVEIEDK